MEVEFLDIDKRNAWGSVFQEIRNESNNFHYVIKDAKKTENKNLNRYRDVNPFDHSRVRLKRGEKDYINASLVEVPSANRSYILTQGPLPVTTGHFWLMIWEQKSKAILMLNHVIEKNAVKCHLYWPIGCQNGGDDELHLLDVNLKVTFLNQKEETYYTIREFLITDLEKQDSRKVLQFHYTTWPDFGVPESPAAFLKFLFDVREFGVLSPDVGPVVVHCSAGIGRSGTFCLVDSCLVLIEKSKDPDSINIREQLLEMRRYRMGLIQTPDQLRFSYLAIIEGAKQVLSGKLPSTYVPLNQNSIEVDKNSSNVDNCAKEKAATIIETNGIPNSSPPPLPPRSIRYSEDVSLSSISSISPTIKSLCNGELKSNTIENMQMHLKHENMPHKNSSDEKISDNYNEISLHSKLPNRMPASFSEQTDSLAEIRKRARKEREEKTSALVQNIKKKQKESELWDKRRSFIKLSLGLVLIIGLGYMVYKNYSKS